MVSLPCHSLIQLNKCCFLSFHCKGTQQLGRTGPFTAPWKKSPDLGLVVLNMEECPERPATPPRNGFLNALALLVGNLLGASSLRGPDRSKLGALWAFLPPLAGADPHKLWLHCWPKELLLRAAPHANHSHRAARRNWGQRLSPEPAS